MIVATLKNPEAPCSHASGMLQHHASHGLIIVGFKKSTPVMNMIIEAGQFITEDGKVVTAEEVMGFIRRGEFGKLPEINGLREALASLTSAELESGN